MTASLGQVFLLGFGLFVVPWVLVFGGAGGLLAHTRGGSWALGTMWGVCLGPVGWIAVWLTTRKAQRARMAQWADETLTAPPERPAPPRVIASVPRSEDAPRRRGFL